MKRFRLLIAAALVTLATPAFAQQAVLRNTTITASGTASAVSYSLIGLEGVSVSVTGAGTYTLEFQGYNGTAWVSFPGIQLSDFTRDVQATTPDTWFFGNLGFTQIRVYASAYTSGAPRITIVRGFGNVNAPYSAGAVSGANAAASTTGVAVPSSAGYTGLNIGGNLVGWTGLSLGATTRAGQVAIVDAAGAQITSFGGGTQYTHDAALTPGTSLGTLAMGRASATAPVNATVIADDAVLPWYTLAGAQATQVTFGGIVASAGSGVTDTGTQRVTLASDSTGVLAGVTTVATVTNVATIGTSVTPGGGAAHLGKAEDAIAGTGDTGVSFLAVAQAVPTATAADGDYINVKTDATGRLWINCGAGCSGGTQYAEDVAHVTADIGNLVHTIRRNTTPAASADLAGDYAALNTDGNGRLFTNATLYNAAGAELSLASDATFGATSPTGGPAVGLRAETTSPVAVTDGQHVAAMGDVTGRQYTINGADANPIVAATGCAIVSAATTNATSCKATAGNLYGFRVVNTTATLYYLRLYNTAAAPNCTLATGFVESIPIPASATGAGIVAISSIPEAYKTGIGYCLTGGSSSTDNTAAAVGLFGRVLYK